MDTSQQPLVEDSSRTVEAAPRVHIPPRPFQSSASPSSVSCTSTHLTPHRLLIVCNPPNVAHHVVHPVSHRPARHVGRPQLSEEDNVLRLCKRPSPAAAKETRSAQAKRRRQSKVGLLHLQDSTEGSSSRRSSSSQTNADPDLPIRVSFPSLRCLSPCVCYRHAPILALAEMRRAA